jgi:hypothetical protein
MDVAVAVVMAGKITGKVVGKATGAKWQNNWQGGWQSDWGQSGRFGNGNGRGFGRAGVDPYRLQSIVYHVENEMAEQRVRRRNVMTTLIASQCGPEMATALATAGGLGDNQDPLATTLLLSQVMNRNCYSSKPLHLLLHSIQHSLLVI